MVKATDADYETLGVSRGASKDEIKRAYREAARANHPDMFGGDTGKMQDINNAMDNFRYDWKHESVHQDAEGVKSYNRDEENDRVRQESAAPPPEAEPSRSKSSGEDKARQAPPQAETTASAGAPDSAWQSKYEDHKINADWAKTETWEAMRIRFARPSHQELFRKFMDMGQPGLGSVRSVWRDLNDQFDLRDPAIRKYLLILKDFAAFAHQGVEGSYLTRIAEVLNQYARLIDFLSGQTEGKVSLNFEHFINAEGGYVFSEELFTAFFKQREAARINDEYRMDDEEVGVSELLRDILTRARVSKEGGPVNRET